LLLSLQSLANYVDCFEVEGAKRAKYDSKDVISKVWHLDFWQAKLARRPPETSPTAGWRQDGVGSVWMDVDINHTQRLPEYLQCVTNKVIFTKDVAKLVLRHQCDGIDRLDATM
jgi:hypothetical protein